LRFGFLLACLPACLSAPADYTAGPRDRNVDRPTWLFRDGRQPPDVHNRAMFGAIVICGLWALAGLAALMLFAAPFLQGQYKDVPERPIEHRHKPNVGND
jgi:hypothetical protein